MYTRAKLLILFGLLFSLMTLMINHSATTSEVHQRGEAPWAGVLLEVLAIVGLFILLGLFLEWRDPFRRDDWGGFGLSTYLPLVIAGALVGLIFLGLWSPSPSPFPPNNTSGLVNLSSAPPNFSRPPTYHNDTRLAGAGLSLPFRYILYAVFLVAIAVFAYVAVVQYRGLLWKKGREEMRLKAELFDKKLDDLGLDAFENPREAIVGIYRNAVLWLEYLGIPYEESWTHWEHARHVKYMHDAFVELTRLFEKAKYAPEKITWKDAERVLEVYRTMRRGVDEV
ncbi:DUF4129 domain-containing protein [Thermococcus celer]|uniref:Protein-glutamine gamma-glutamyltransferase-like C-terminal domain-containing protein n=1 Tax=Thermococcus celer Vu 13 = JCM 8558 TaxID=1293037 RepID=A0A218P364_THECE|nr:DUF4129 domain-containing protein [Thermococcus celer]ASI99356.1 hypothetical protein A3L02_07205 [Thermococcus celer Vu 13 = JCM 8558]